MKSLTFAAIAALLTVPGAMAYVDSGAITEPFAPLLPPEANAVIPQFYLDEDGSVWQESNACAGLQRAGGAHDGCGDVAADTQVAALPSL